MKRIFMVLVSVTLISALFVSGVFADALQGTRVEGIKTKIKASTNSQISTEILVEPAYGRTAMLQMLDDNNTWKTKEEFYADESYASYIDVEFPNDWKKKTNSQWRIVISEKPGEIEAYTSPTISIDSAPYLSCKSAIIMNADTGKIIFSKNMNKQLKNASTTKMMTAILALERDDMDSKVTITKNTVNTPWKSLYFTRGDKFYLRDLMKSLMVISDNGSATAIAEHVSGSVGEFCREMNDRALELGCMNTNFTNPHGLDSRNHYSSSYDLALILKKGMENPTFSKLMSSTSFSMKSLKNRKAYSGKSFNTLIDYVAGALGGKTGWTGGAGGCYAGAYESNGSRYITVVLGCKTGYRFKDTQQLYKMVDAQTEVQ